VRSNIQAEEEQGLKRPELGYEAEGYKHRKEEERGV
jgi:hypothetical protein